MPRFRFCSTAVLLTTAAILTACQTPPPPDTSTDVGKVDGDILFNNVSPSVSTYLAAHSVTSSGSVRFHPKGAWGPAAASTQYQAENIIPAPGTYKAASYNINPPVDAAINEFLIEVNSVHLGSTATYRFGTRNPDPSAPAAQSCGPVPSLVADPAGIRCDVSECAVLVPVRLRLTGAAADIDGLEPNIPPVSCVVRARIAEVPAGLPSSIQATATAAFPRDDLRGSGQVVDVLVRADGSTVALSASCSALPKPGEENYAINTSTGLAGFGGDAAGTLTPTCGAGPWSEVPIDILVQRNAGDLTGLFDVSGHDEAANPRITVATNTTSFATASPVPAAAQPTVPWVIQGIPAGDHVVRADSITLSGDAHVRFPETGDDNAPPVTIIPGVTTDLGSTFVAKPRLATGKVILHDPPGNTDLSALLTPPFNQNQISNPILHRENTSFVTALGSQEFALPGPDATAASGRGGLAQGLLKNVTPLAGTGGREAGYELLLTGISPRTGPTDGSGALPTPWDVKELRLRMAPTNSNEGVTVLFNRDLHYVYTPPSGTDTSSISVPDQEACFGKINVHMEAPPALGTLYRPRILATLSPVSAVNTSIPGVVYRASGNATGSPVSAATSASVATVALTLPEGIQYPIRPFVWLVSPTGSSTWLTLNQLSVPSDGTIACGQTAKICININDANGAYTPLVVNLDPTPQYCQPSGSFALNVSVDSGGADVDAVVYSVDSGPQVVLCTSCGADPSGLPIDLSGLGLTTGDHSVLIEAFTQGNCSGELEYAFRIPDTPLSVQCTPLVEVALEGTETSIEATDPRVAPALAPQVTGDSCGFPTDVTPHLADIPPFPVGETQVVFSLSEPDTLIPAGGSTCTTTVRVTNAPLLAFRSQTFNADPVAPTEFHINFHRFMDNTAVPLVQQSSPQTFFFTYDRSGERLAIISNATGLIRIIDTATGSDLETRPVPTGYKLYNTEFHPQDASKYAIVGSETANPDQHAIFIFFDPAQPPNRLDLPLFSSTLRISRALISWSPDGGKISAAFTQPAPAVDRYDVWVSEWNVVNDQITPPVSGIFHGRPGLANREILRELVYQDPDWRAIGSDKSVTRAIKRPSIEQIFPIYGQINRDLDLTEDGKAAALIYGLPLAPGGPTIVLGVEPLDQNTVPTVHQSPTILNARSVAISSDAAFVAVASDQPGPVDKVFVYSFPNFILVKEIDTHLPGNLTFKPR